MQRNRQALGVISTNNAYNQAAHNKPSANGGPLKQAAAASSKAVVNDENELAKTSKTENFDFDIYQEEVVAATAAAAAVSKAATAAVKATKLKEAMNHNLDFIESITAYPAKSSNKENDVQEEDEEEEEEDDREEEDEEEEGISRLNLAAGERMMDQDLVSMMDSSTVTAELLSPMVLDDTIKFQSHLSTTHEIDVEHENESEQEDEEDDDACAELDEDAKRQQMLAEHENLIMSCLEYKDDILAYMREQELLNRPKASYMKKQQDINSSMRCILVDWLVEVCEEYRLNMETLYLAVNYTDRFLSQMSVLRGKLQLVGTASMYIASKYEEITPPDVSEFVYITDDTYTKKQVLRMEHLLLKVLDFNMNAPTANWFLNHYLRFGKRHYGIASAQEYARFESLARYLCELTLVDADTFLTYLPSQIAASAIHLALLCFDRPWTKQIGDALGYDLGAELRACIGDLHAAMQQAPAKPQQAIIEKYKSAKYHQASLVSPPKQLPELN